MNVLDENTMNKLRVFASCMEPEDALMQFSEECTELSESCLHIVINAESIPDQDNYKMLHDRFIMEAADVRNAILTLHEKELIDDIRMPLMEFNGNLFLNLALMVEKASRYAHKMRRTMGHGQPTDDSMKTVKAELSVIVSALIAWLEGFEKSSLLSLEEEKKIMAFKINRGICGFKS